MFARRQPSDRTEWSGLDQSRLLLALVVSLLLHLVIYGTYRTGHALGWWEKLHWSRLSKVVEEMQEAQARAADPDQQPPLMFVDVRPQMEPVEPPKDTPYYSDRNSRAANPLTDKESDVPLVDGTQTEMVKTEDVPPLKAVPLQPALPKVEPLPPPPEEKEAEEQVEEPKGDLVVAKVEEPQEKQEKQELKPPDPKPRPRTLKEAMERMPQAQVNALAGRKMKQEGGVRRLAVAPSLDVRASPFGEYDRAIIVAIQNRWFDLLDMRGFGHEKSGKVVLEFRLHYDGRVSQMSETKNTVDEMLGLLCRKAVLDPAPFARWPSDMRRMIGEDYRDVKFTFYYN